MKILAGIVGSILLSLAATSAGAVIMFSPTPSGTGNNVLRELAVLGFSDIGKVL
jgi:hypothetical protein